MNGTEVDITEFPQNIHEYHKMMATAQAKAMEIQQAIQQRKTEEKEVEQSESE